MESFSNQNSVKQIKIHFILRFFKVATLCLDDSFAHSSWLMSWNVASIYPHNFTFSWFHLFCEVHQSLLQLSTPTTWCCHPRVSQLGWCSWACKHPPFSSKHNNGHYGQKVIFLFHQTRGHFSKKYNLCPHVQLQTVVWLFYGGLGAVASSFLSSLSGYVDIGLE